MRYRFEEYAFSRLLHLSDETEALARKRLDEALLLASIADGRAFDIDRRELHCGAEVVSVAPQVFDLLEYLIRNRERVVSKDDLINAVWKGRIVSDAALTDPSECCPPLLRSLTSPPSRYCRSIT